jgi:hypothetical protein
MAFHAVRGEHPGVLECVPIVVRTDREDGLGRDGGADHVLVPARPLGMRAHAADHALPPRRGEPADAMTITEELT